MARKRKNLTYADRQKIEHGLRQGKSIVAIANDVGRTRQTIYLELKRCFPYSADEAQKSLYT